MASPNRYSNMPFIFSVRITVRILAILFVAVRDPQALDYAGTMKLIPAKDKTFAMGDSSLETAAPVHDVTITYDFYMDSTEVTQEDYRSIMGKNPALYRGDRHPVENVTWNQAILYCNERSKKDDLDTVYQYSEASDFGLMDLAIDTSIYGYRLPTEAEWEFACRAGSSHRFFWGDDIDGQYCHYEDSKTQYDATAPVALKLPNGYGLYDMIGNVWEYVNDAMLSYEADAQTNPLAWKEDAGTVVVRGGSHEDRGEKLQTAYREGVIPFYSEGAPIYGFRAVLPVGDSSKLSSAENTPRLRPAERSRVTEGSRYYTLRGRNIGTSPRVYGVVVKRTGTIEFSKPRLRE